MSEIKVEIGQYWEINKGALLGSFSYVEYPKGQKVIDCKHFKQDDREWWSGPQKEIKKKDDEKSQYIPYISYIDKEYDAKLKAAVLTELQKRNSNGQKQNRKDSGAENSLQSKSPSDWF